MDSNFHGRNWNETLFSGAEISVYDDLIGPSDRDVKSGRGMRLCRRLIVLKHVASYTIIAEEELFSL